LAQEAELRRAVEESGERVCLVRARADLADPRLRLVLSMEGVEPLEGDPARSRTGMYGVCARWA
jgi:hypothetical protein